MHHFDFDKIEELIQLDVDAAECYTKAIDKTDDEMIRERLISYRDDHERHVVMLSNYMVENDQNPPKRSPDLKGYLLEGFTAMRSASGTEGALKAMKSNEKLTNKKYDEASSWDMPADLAEIVRRGYEDEKRHLAYIEQQISMLAHTSR